MKNNFIVFILVLFSLAFSGCMGITTIMPSSSSIGIEKGNYIILGNVKEVETSSYILGIGGMKDKNGALSNLYKKAHLQPNEAIINVDYVKQSRLYFPMGFFYTKVTYTASGQKVRFVDSPVAQKSVSLQGEKMGFSQPMNQTVMYKTDTEEEMKTYSNYQSDSTLFSLRENRYLYKFLKKNFDKNLDGELDSEEILKIEILDLTKSRICNLSGIEALKNLRILKLFGYGNYMEGYGNSKDSKPIDLSKNLKLESLSSRYRIKTKNVVILPEDGKDIKIDNIDAFAIVRTQNNQ